MGWLGNITSLDINNILVLTIGVAYLKYLHSVFFIQLESTIASVFLT